MINMSDVKWASSISVDKLGRSFFINDKCYRGIYQNQVSRVKRLFESGLIKELTELKYILPLNISEECLSDEQYGMVLETKKIKNVVYATEWSFSMMLDAALFMLKMEKVLLKYGFTFYDYHPHNLLFDANMKLYHVDLGSIVLSDKNSVLLFVDAMKKKYFRTLYKWMKTGKRDATFWLFDNETDDQEWEVFYKGFEACNPSTTDEIIDIETLDDLDIAFSKLSDDFNHLNEKNQLDWSAYQNEFFDQNGKVKEYERFRIISSYLKKYNIRCITELAANQGAFSQYCIEHGIIDYSMAIDVDESAVNTMYGRVKKTQLPINMGILDLVQPKTRDVFQNFERLKNDAVIAMALIHHLCLTQGVSMETVVDLIGNYGTEWIVIEFMPLGLWDGTGGLGTPYWWTLDNFKNVLMKKYDIVEEEKIELNRVLLVGRRK